jgi:hypothetical protein
MATSASNKKTTTPIVVRKFKGQPVEMLTALAILMELVELRQTDLIKYYEDWKNPFFKNLKDLIDKIIKDYIGVDGAKGLRNATLLVTTIQDKALDDLTSLKKQIEIRIKDKTQQSEYLKQLGFDSYYFDAKSKKSQIDLINLLFQADKSLDTTTLTDLTSKKIVASLLSNIKAYAKTLNDANVNQESIKITKSSNTAEATNAFNNVYEQVMDVVQLTADYYKKDKEYASKLSYNATIKSVQGKSSIPKKGKDVDNTTDNKPKDK